MIRPICYNIPEGKSEQEALSDELLEALEGFFQAVTHAYSDDATLYRLDIGRIHESVKAGGLVVAGQFVDRSDGEVFDFEINQGTNEVRYLSTGNFLEEQELVRFLGGDAGRDVGEDGNSSESSDSGPYPFELLLQAINDERSEAYQSPFASKLRKDLDYLGALSALMYHAGATIEAQPLYTGLYSYAIKYALRGLRLFSQSIGSLQGEEAGKAAEAWVDEHGLDFASAVVKEFSARRCARFQESIQAEDQDAIQELKTLVEEAIGMAMSTTSDLIKSVVEADDYRAGDVQATLAAAIEEYCPIDNSEGYSAVENARQLSEEWQEVVNRSGCSEDLSMQALGLPSAEIIPSEKGDSQATQLEPEVERGSDNDDPLDGERIFYVNVGEGPSRNWDDCRQFGFLAAGGGRKWSKQLEKIKTGDTVIAYLKGYGYVGIGKVTTTATPATKFTVNGVSIKELPLINDTIRSIKRFSKENGEYLIGIDWEVAVPRENAAWRANAGLYTTALVCASLGNQLETIGFARSSLAPFHAANSEMQRLTCAAAIEALSQGSDDDSCDVESILDRLTSSEWLSDEEFGRFFIEVSNNLFEESKIGDGSGVNLFGREITYSFYPGTSIWDLWVKARKIKSIVDRLEGEMDCLPGEMFSTFNIIPAAYAADYNNQSLDTWLANVPTEFSHEDNEFFCTLIAAMEEYPASTLWDIVRNIRSSPVLDELIFCSPQLILSDEYLLGGNLLENPSLSEDAISFLASLLLEIRLPENFAGKTESDLGVVSVGEKTISSFRLDFAEQIEALDKEEIAVLINAHPKCTDFLRKQISRIDQLSSLQNMSNQVHAFIEAVRVNTGLLEKLRTVYSDDAVVKIANEAGFMISNDEYRVNLSARQELEIILMEADYK